MFRHYEIKKVKYYYFIMKAHQIIETIVRNCFTEWHFGKSLKSTREDNCVRECF